MIVVGVGWLMVAACCFLLQTVVRCDSVLFCGRCALFVVARCCTSLLFVVVRWVSLSVAGCWLLLFGVCSRLIDVCCLVVCVVVVIVMWCLLRVDWWQLCVARVCAVCWLVVAGCYGVVFAVAC